MPPFFNEEIKMSKKVSEESVDNVIGKLIEGKNKDEIRELYSEIQDVLKDKGVDALDFNDKLRLAIKDIENSSDKIDYDGKKYTTVAKRIEIVRKYFGFDVQIKTENISVNDNTVVFKASLVLHTDKGTREISTGHAEEKRTASEMNKKAAYEVAETSAIGRALGNAGLSGGEFASANELAAVGAIKSKVSDDLLSHLKAYAKTSKTSWKTALSTQGVQDETELTEDKALKLLTIFLKTINNTNKNSATSQQIEKDTKNTKEKVIAKNEVVESSNAKPDDGLDIPL
jgi:hypothetical protein